MPSMERFERQPDSYRQSVLPGDCRKRVAIEAGVAQPWFRYVGLEGTVVSIERFGLSAPGGEALAELGMSVEKLVAAARNLD